MKSDSLVYDKAKSQDDQKHVNDRQISKLIKNHDAVCFNVRSKQEIEKKGNNFYQECFWNSGERGDSFTSIQGDNIDKKSIEFASQKIKKRPKPDIKSKYKEIIAKFNNSITKRRNLDTNTIIDNILNQSKKGNLNKVYGRDNYEIVKFLQLGKLNITYINPVTEFRYNDYIFP